MARKPLTVPPSATSSHISDSSDPLESPPPVILSRRYPTGIPGPVCNSVVPPYPVPLTGNPDATLILQWNANPPVKQLQPDAFAAAADEFDKNVRGLTFIDPLPPFANEDVDAQDWCTPQRTYQERWNNRLTSTLTMLEEPLNIISSDRPKLGFAYFVDKTPVGLMAVSPNAKSLLISDLVTHPLSEGVGACLIEQAVSTSMELGSEGKLELWSLDEDSERAYLKMGFRKIIRNHMELDPSETDKWIEQDGKWLIDNNRNRKYIG
ncbi:MAG: hypothetical protein P4L50_04700 [Anaerolineaceae bacterium]|nr:hypothetical protein [Anaerolineaceae bacterium]